MDKRFITKEPTPGGSVYVKPQDADWKPSQFEGIQIKVLYERPEVGELTCLLKWEPGAKLPFHQHPELEQSFVLEGSFYDHDGILSRGRICVAATRLLPRDPQRRRRSSTGDLSQA